MPLEVSGQLAEKTNLRILIVDDVAMMRNLLRHHLEIFGTCDFAENGQQAVAMFEQALQDKHPYHLIFLDIMLPIMDGHQALKAIRQIEKDRHIPPEEQAVVIMTSALRDRKNVLQSVEEGCDDYLIKPFNKKKVIEKIVKATIRRFKAKQNKSSLP